MKKCAVIYNPKSGKLKNMKEFLKVTEKILNQYGYGAEFFKTSKVGDATNIIVNLNDIYSLVIIAGGDGTLNEAVTGNVMREKKFLLASLPIGTTNDVATMYGYTKNYKKDLELLLNGTIRNVDICLLNSKPFIYVACLGNYVDVSYATPRKWKERFGRIGYLLYGVKRIFRKLKQYSIEYEIDGKKYQGNFSFLFITNSSRVAGLEHLYKNVKLNDNMFEVAFCEAKRKRELIKMVPAILSPVVKKIPEIVYHRTDNLIVKLNNSIKESWCLDGEEYCMNDNIFHFHIQNNMQMLIPKKNVQKLFKEEFET